MGYTYTWDIHYQIFNHFNVIKDQKREHKSTAKNIDISLRIP